MRAPQIETVSENDETPPFILKEVDQPYCDWYREMAEQNAPRLIEKFFDELLTAERIALYHKPEEEFWSTSVKAHIENSKADRLKVVKIINDVLSGKMEALKTFSEEISIASSKSGHFDDEFQYRFQQIMIPISKTLYNFRTKMERLGLNSTDDFCQYNLGELTNELLILSEKYKNNQKEKTSTMTERVKRRIFELLRPLLHELKKGGSL